jgi:hypothetical protein
VTRWQRFWRELLWWAMFGAVAWLIGLTGFLVWLGVTFQ